MFQSWTLALTILNMSLISAIMALGVNMQWGYAGLFNVGIMGFTALGGLAVVLIAMPPVPRPGPRVALGAFLGLAGRGHDPRGSTGLEADGARQAARTGADRGAGQWAT
jgi:ABC-type branched-subunit amino acid transport system permease subunit